MGSIPVGDVYVFTTLLVKPGMIHLGRLKLRGRGISIPLSNRKTLGNLKHGDLLGNAANYSWTLKFEDRAVERLFVLRVDTLC